MGSSSVPRNLLNLVNCICVRVFYAEVLDGTSVQFKFVELIEWEAWEKTFLIFRV